jgi:predicted metalloprotease with PDZ domain
VCARENAGRSIEIGTTGYTMDHVFVLYDRESESVWYPNVNDSAFEAVAGRRRGDTMTILAEPAPLPLSEWLAAHPASAVLLPPPEDLARRERRRPYMGVELGQREEGLFITSVGAETPAEVAGLQDGDRILGLGDVEIATRSQFSEFLSEQEPGDTLTVVVVRAGEVVAVELILGRRE